MKNRIWLLLPLILFAKGVFAQCDAGFTFTVNQGQVNFTSATTAPLKHSWIFGDGSFNYSQANPVHQYTTAGTYQVKHIVRDSITNCADSISQTVTIAVSANCSVDIAFARMSPTSNQYMFYAVTSPTGISIQSSSWTVNGVTAANLSSFYHVFSQQGTYAICLRVVFTNGCVAEKCMQLNFVPYGNCNLNASFTWTAGAPQGRQVNFTALPNQSQLQYNWEFGDGSTASGRTVSHLYNVPGSYRVRLQVRDSLASCYDTLVNTVTIATLPSDTCSFSFGYGLSNDGNASFTAFGNQPATSLTWTIRNLRDSLDQVVLQGNNPVYQFTDTGIYIVCLQAVTASGCRDSFCDQLYVTSAGGRAGRVIPAFPNPVRGEPSIRIEYSSRRAGIAPLKVYGLSGNVVYQVQQPVQQGLNIITLPVHQLHAGQYFIDIGSGNEKRRAVFQKM